MKELYLQHAVRHPGAHSARAGVASLQQHSNSALNRQTLDHALSGMHPPTRNTVESNRVRPTHTWSGLCRGALRNGTANQLKRLKRYDE